MDDGNQLSAHIKFHSGIVVSEIEFYRYFIIRIIIEYD